MTIRLLTVLPFFLSLFIAKLMAPDSLHSQSIGMDKFAFIGSVPHNQFTQNNFAINNDTSAIVINEILANPTRDVNGDGIINSGDEFVEIVNASTSGIDISEWKLSDGEAIMYTFPSGTVLSPNKAVVVFGGGNPTGYFGTAAVYVAEELSLYDNSSEIILLNRENKVIQTVTYRESIPDQSITREPEITGNFVTHVKADQAGSSLFSPGTAASGGALNPNFTYAKKIRGGEGWRIIATPAKNTTFADLLSNLSTDFGASSESPTIYSWSETNSTFEAANNMSDILDAGKGYIVYLSGDDRSGIPDKQNDFSKIIKTYNTENSSPVRVSVGANDANNSGTIDGSEGWNLLGNPFGTAISVTAVKDALKEVNPNLNANIAIWDHTAGSGNGRYIQISDDDNIAPFQAFWIRYTVDFGSGTATFNKNDLAAENNTIYAGTVQQKTNFDIYLGDGEKFDTYRISFRKNGNIGEGQQDAYKLFSLNAGSINLFSTLGDDIKLAVNVLPPAKELDRKIRVPLGYQLPHSGEYTFSWDEMDELPQELELYLIDNKTDRKRDLRINGEFSFNYQDDHQEKLRTKQERPLLNKTKNVNSQPRFELMIVSQKSKTETSTTEIDEPVTLSPNYPNPFSAQTTMDLVLKENMHVSITVWNIVGQKVATLKDEMMQAGGPYPMTWNAASNLPSGIYICKLEADGTVLIRKMTLIK